MTFPLRIVFCAVLLCLPAMAAAQSPSIEINGTSEALQQNIRAHLSIGSERCGASQGRLQRLLPQVRRNTRRALEALGHYHSEIDAGFSRNEDDSCWRLQLDVTPGQAVQIREINIAIQGDEADRELFGELMEDPPLARGEILSHADYERLKSRLSSIAVENGYFSARFNRSELAVDLQENTADVHIEFAPGERFRFGEIRINEMEALSGEFISRFLSFDSGSYYSSDELATLRENLNNSQYFSRISVTPDLNQAQGDRIPVSVQLTPRKRRSYSAGLGVSTDVGPRLSLGYEDRYITRSGHRLNADLTVSPQRQDPSLSYFIPLSDPANESLRLSGGFRRQETDSYTTRAYQMGINHRSLAGSWVQNIFTNFQHETARLEVTTQQTNTAISGISWSRSRSDDPIHPSRGWRLHGEVSGAHESLLSDVSFTQFYGSGKWIESIGPGRVLLRTEVASTLVSDVEKLPVSARYFTGGDQSIRGYEWSSLGTRNAEGEVIGGKNLLVGSIEYDFPVRENWNLAAFMDAGNAVNDFANMSLKRSAGLGLRWLSPIGAIRVDVARALDDPGGWRLHLTMGPDL